MTHKGVGTRKFQLLHGVSQIEIHVDHNAHVDVVCRKLRDSVHKLKYSLASHTAE